MNFNVNEVKTVRYLVFKDFLYNRNENYNLNIEKNYNYIIRIVKEVQLVVIQDLDRHDFCC